MRGISLRTSTARRAWTWNRVLRTIGLAFPHLVLIVFSAAAVIPFGWMAMASFKPFKELCESRSFFPITWTLSSYLEIVTRVNFMSAFRNNVIVSVTITGSTLLTSSALGFVFSKYRFWGREVLFTVLLATMMVPGAVTLVPLYLVVSGMGLLDMLAGVIVPGLWSTFGLFMMRQFMESLPNEIIDAARIDGAGELRIFAGVVLPMSTAPLAALAIMAFLGAWDNFLWPMIVLTSPDQQTLPLVLAGLRSLYWTRYEIYAAGSMLTVLPVMIVYSLGSKYFIRGVAMSGLKV